MRGPMSSVGMLAKLRMVKIPKVLHKLITTNAHRLSTSLSSATCT